MDEKVINEVISQYALEQANLRVTIALLKSEVVRLTEELDKSKTEEGE